MPFPSALKDFYENGYFGLTDSQLYYENICSLQKRTQHLNEDKPEINVYQICLNNISLIPGIQPPKQKPLITGRIIEHPSRAWEEAYTDVALTQMATLNQFNVPLSFRDQEEIHGIHIATLKQALISLLVQPAWRSIELEHTFFYKNHQLDYVTTQLFYNNLLNSLAQNKFLRELTIKPFALSRHRKSLVNFLTQNASLEFLHLQITEANKQDWLELCDILSTHPSLKWFHLDTTSILDANAYSALRKLLDENYRIEVVLPEPIDTDLLEAYEPLRQRLLKPGLERFKEDHLTQARLLHVATTALEYLYKLKSTDQIKKQVLFKKQFDFLVGNEGHLAITNYQKEEWIKSTKVLPVIYQNHKEYLKDESPLLQLQMNELVPDGSRTIGYALMEKALETQNQVALKTLLDTNVNLFEFPPNTEEPFLVKALQTKGGLKNVVVEYIQADQRLTALASEYLAAYPKLIDLFKEFKDHLDGYGTHLVKKDNPPILLSIAKKILITWRKILDLENPSGKRGKECAQIYLTLDRSLQIIGQTPEEDSYDSFDEVHKIMIKMKEDSIKALRGFFNSSFLHEKVLELIKEFEMQLLAGKKEIDHGKDERIKHRDDEIKQFKKEKCMFDQKFEKMEARNTELRARAEREADQNAELRARNAEMEKQLKALMRQMRISTFNSETPSDDSSSAYDETNVDARGFFRP